LRELKTGGDEKGGRLGGEQFDYFVELMGAPEVDALGKKYNQMNAKPVLNPQLRVLLWRRWCGGNDFRRRSRTLFQKKITQRTLGCINLLKMLLRTFHRLNDGFAANHR